MDKKSFSKKAREMLRDQEQFLDIPNKAVPGHGNGIYERYNNPVLTRDHVPLSWRFDINHDRNPHLLERLGINAVFNAGAIEHNGAIHVVARVEGNDRKSFFAVASSESGIDRFHFAAKPVELPLTDEPDVNVYDMRLTRHEDGNIYGVFCTERMDPKAAQNDTSSAVAQCGIVRTKDLVSWERLSDIRTESPQQRNVVLHPEFIDGQYAFYTRPQDDFIQSGSGGGIGFGLSKTIERAEISKQVVVDPRVYHTIKEVKNGAGAPPIKTAKGWLHIAHGVRNTAAGMRYVLYVLLCDLNDPSRVIASPGGYFIAPMGDERTGDVSNVVFCNGAVARDDGSVFIYYASSDTRLHVATSSVERLLDYALNTPPDGLTTQECVKQRINLIERNVRQKTQRRSSHNIQ